MWEVSKSNDAPGWLVLGKGYKELLTLENGFLLAKGEM